MCTSLAELPSWLISRGSGYRGRDMRNTSAYASQGLRGRGLSQSEIPHLATNYNWVFQTAGWLQVAGSVGVALRHR